MSAPSRLGPLALETRLGDHPSQSQVWRAVHLELRRSLAVKIFPTPFGPTPEAKSALAEEWARLKSLSHPGIAKCYGGGFEPGWAYLASELIDGETLSHQLSRQSRQPWEVVLDLCDGLTESLVYLHAAGITHGRLVPSKIVVAGLSPVLVDVRTDRYGSPFRSTRPPTPDEQPLVAPEVLTGGDPTPGGDLYSLAAIAYLAATGRPPGGHPIGDISGGQPIEIAPPSSIVPDLPVWIDRLLMPILSADPLSRPGSAEAVRLQLAETRRRCFDRTSVTGAAAKGFSPLDTNNQTQRAETRRLLGKTGRRRGKKHGAATTTSGSAIHDALAGNSADNDSVDHEPWYQSATALFTMLMAAVALAAFMLWPLSEDQMRQRAERLLADGTRASFSQAKNRYLTPMLANFPDGEHADWAGQQIQRIEMEWAESVLNTRIKKNLPLTDEGQRLYAEASRYERFGDRATALDRYRSLVTLMKDEPKYLPYVNLARRQIAAIESESAGDTGGGEAARLIQSKLDQSDRLIAAGKTIPARSILYSIIELYGTNAEVRPMVEAAQQRIAGLD